MANAIIGLMKDMNVFGMGGEPIAIMLAGMMTLFMCQKLIKEKDYAQPAIVFGINWTLMATIGIGGSWQLIAVYYFIVLTGIIFTSRSADKVAHTIENVGK